MKIYNNQKEVEKDVVNWILRVDDDIQFTFNLKMDIDIKAYDIYADDIDVNNIDAINIKCHNINANYVKANSINANDIKIINVNINNIIYYGVCVPYKTFKYKSLKSIIK